MYWRAVPATSSVYIWSPAGQVVAPHPVVPVEPPAPAPASLPVAPPAAVAPPEPGEPPVALAPPVPLEPPVALAPPVPGEPPVALAPPAPVVPPAPPPEVVTPWQPASIKAETATDVVAVQARNRLIGSPPCATVPRHVTPETAHP